MKQLILALMMTVAFESQAQYLEMELGAQADKYPLVGEMIGREASLDQIGEAIKLLNQGVQPDVVRETLLNQARERELKKQEEQAIHFYGTPEAMQQPNGMK